MLLLSASAALAQPDIAPATARLPHAARPWEDFATAAEQAIERRIAAERAQFAPAAPQLAPDPDLMEIARSRSQSMADGAAFAHEDAAGNFLAADLVRTRFGPYGVIGENIMEMGSSRRIDPGNFARIAVEGWMNSPGHRRNILDPDYNRSGIGVALKNGTAYATQVFFGPPKRAGRARP